MRTVASVAHGAIPLIPGEARRRLDRHPRLTGRSRLPLSDGGRRRHRLLARSRSGRRAGAEAETSASRQGQPPAVPGRCSRLTRRADTRSLGPPRDSRNNPCSRQGDQVVAPGSTGRGVLVEEDHRRLCQDLMSSSRMTWRRASAARRPLTGRACPDGRRGGGGVRSGTLRKITRRSTAAAGFALACPR
jgi:hypothetical protein